MKKFYILCICIFICELTYNHVYAQGGTKNTPWPGSSFTYSLGSGTDSGNFTWWVSSSATSTQPGDAGTLTYGTDYSIVGYSGGVPSGVSNLESITIQWGSGIGSYSKLYVFVKSATSNGCSNTRYYTVTPVNDFNASVVDVTKASNLVTATGPAHSSGTECPDETGLVTENTSYSPGYTTFNFRVDRKLSMNPWSFNYTISASADGTTLDAGQITSITAVGGTTTSSSIGTTGAITGVAGDGYFVISFQVINQPGKSVTAKLSISGAKDTSTGKTDSNSSDDSANHNILSMPAIGSFN